jgi:hypothetical protein
MKNTEPTLMGKESILSVGKLQGTRLLRYRTYSTHGRRYKTNGRPCRPTSRRVGIECEGRTDRGFSLDGARDPALLKKICAPRLERSWGAFVRSSEVYATTVFACW